MKNFSIKFLSLAIFILLFSFYKFCCVRTIHAEPPTFKINLDLEPEERWNTVIEALPRIKILEFAQNFQTVLNHLKIKIAPYMTQLTKSTIMPEEYKRELNSIVKALERKFSTLPPSLSYENLFFLNIAYELFVCCTSGIIVGAEETPYLFRNLDWPFLMSSLRACTVTIEWYKNNSCLFKCTGFPFIIGVYTGQKDHHFAVSINSRHVLNGSISENFAHYLKNQQNRWPICILTRYVLQYAHNYHEAYNIYKNSKLIAPAYVALAGTTKNDGVILACDRDKIKLIDDISSWLTYYPHKNVHINPQDQNSPLILDPQRAQTSYIVISNIDPDYNQQNVSNGCKTGCCTSPLQVEKKRESTGPEYRRNTTLNSCHALPSKFTAKDLFKKVLYLQPTQNKFTIYSTVMCPQKNILTSYTP